MQDFDIHMLRVAGFLFGVGFVCFWFFGGFFVWLVFLKRRQIDSVTKQHHLQVSFDHTM